MKSSITWLLSEKLLRLLNGIFIGAAVAKYLGPQSFGVLSVAIATCAAFNAAANMGSEHINIAELSKRDKDKEIFLNSVLMFRIFWSMIVITASLGFLFIEGDGYIESIYLILIVGVPLSAFSIFAHTIASYADFKMLTFISIVGLLFNTCVRLYGIFNECEIDYFAISMIAESIIVVTINGVYLVKQHRISLITFYPDFIIIKKYFYLCFPAAMSGVLVIIYLRLELFIVNYLIGQDAAGQWAAAMMFITPWGMVASSILPVANQVLSKKQLVGSSNYEFDLIRLMRGMMGISILFMGINIISVIIFIPILLGDEYAPVKNIVIICSISLLPLFLGSTQDIWSAQQRKTKTLLRKVVIGLPISMALLWYGGINYGLVGIAVAMTISRYITIIFLNVVLDKKFFLFQLHTIGIGNLTSTR